MYTVHFTVCSGVLSLESRFWVGRSSRVILLGQLLQNGSFRTIPLGRSAPDEAPEIRAEKQAHPHFRAKVNAGLVPSSGRNNFTS